MYSIQKRTYFVMLECVTHEKDVVLYKDQTTFAYDHAVLNAAGFELLWSIDFGKEGYGGSPASPECNAYFYNTRLIARDDLE